MRLKSGPQFPRTQLSYRKLTGKIYVRTVWAVYAFRRQQPSPQIILAWQDKEWARDLSIWPTEPYETARNLPKTSNRLGQIIATIFLVRFSIFPLCVLTG